MSDDAARIVEHLEAVVAAAEATGHDQQEGLHRDLHHAFTIAGVDEYDFGHGRLAATKRAAMRAVRPLSTRQAEFNRTIVATVSRLAQMVLDLTVQSEALAHQVRATLNEIPPSTRAALASYDTVLGDLTEAHEQLRLEQQALADQLATDREELSTRVDEQLGLPGIRGDMHQLSGRLERYERDLAQQRARLELVLRSVKEPSDLTLRSVADDILGVRDSEVYAAFEQRFRGSREDVLEMFAVYEPDLRALERTGPLVDIGSGRGEWLELAGSVGVEAYGVDTNPSFVAAAQERGLDLRLGDGLEHLVGLPPASVQAVTAFHILEHITIGAIEDFLRAAYLTLRPGGLLIVETPNPSNLVVGSSAFWLDPTHLRPLHPDLLSFLVEQHGFEEIEVRYLHPLRDLAHTTGVADPELLDLVRSMEWALFGPQDYAIVASKPGGSKASRQPA